jgi:hypothetical protein
VSRCDREVGWKRKKGTLNPRACCWLAPGVRSPPCASPSHHNNTPDCQRCLYIHKHPSKERVVRDRFRKGAEQLKQKLAVSEGCDERVSSERCGIQRRRRGPGPRVDQAHERRTRVKAAASLPPCTSTTAPTHRPESGAESSNNKAGKEGEEDGRGETDADRSWRRVARPVPLQGAPHDTRPGTPMATCACAGHVPPRPGPRIPWLY